MRIAAGVCVWGKVRPTIYFTEAKSITLCKSEDKELSHYIDLLHENSVDLFTRLPEMPSGLIRSTDEAGLAKLIESADIVLRF
ncbi:MAG TPA: hypothetical protein DCO70_07845 [Verrucomicrobiales bacterium]|nr:hypothetical protein [Verrucomicrobiales bacterium]